MLQFREFFAWVSIDGVEAPEYGVEISEDQKSVTCWIASELGKVHHIVLPLSNPTPIQMRRNSLYTGETRHTTATLLDRSTWTEISAGAK